MGRRQRVRSWRELQLRPGWKECESWACAPPAELSPGTLVHHFSRNSRGLINSSDGHACRDCRSQIAESLWQRLPELARVRRAEVIDKSKRLHDLAGARTVTRELVGSLLVVPVRLQYALHADRCRFEVFPAREVTSQRRQRLLRLVIEPSADALRPLGLEGTSKRAVVKLERFLQRHGAF